MMLYGLQLVGILVFEMVEVGYYGLLVYWIVVAAIRVALLLVFVARFWGVVGGRCCGYFELLWTEFGFCLGCTLAVAGCLVGCCAGGFVLCFVLFKAAVCLRCVCVFDIWCVAVLLLCGLRFALDLDCLRVHTG